MWCIFAPWEWQLPSAFISLACLEFTMRRLAFLRITPLLITLMPGCGGGNSSGPGIPLTVGAATTPVSLTITDTPPLGVQVLFSQLTITGAVLQPGNVSLLNTTNPV